MDVSRGVEQALDTHRYADNTACRRCALPRLHTTPTPRYRAHSLFPLLILALPRAPPFTLFPYTTLFLSLPIPPPNYCSNSRFCTNSQFPHQMIALTPDSPTKLLL